MANYLSVSTKSVEQGQGRLPKLRGQIAPTKVVIADATLYDYESGSVILLGANGIDVTLPAAAAGLNFTFILTANYDTAVCTIIQAAATEDFWGHHFDATTGGSGDSGAASNTKITFTSTSLKGDRVELISDGTVWYVKASGRADSSITFDN